MGKRKAPPIVTTDAASGMTTYDSGIYTESYFRRGADYRKWFFQQLDAAYAAGLNTALGSLEALRKEAFDAIKTASRGNIEDGEPSSHPYGVVGADLGNGMIGHVVPSDEAEVLRERALVLARIDRILSKRPTEAQARLIVEGMELGRILEKIDVLPREAAALNGKYLQRRQEEHVGNMATARRKKPSTVATAAKYYQHLLDQKVKSKQAFERVKVKFNIGATRIKEYRRKQK